MGEEFAGRADTKRPPRAVIVPAACPMRWSAMGYHGYFRTAPLMSRPSLADVTRFAEET
jgi:hypothetical protein